MEWCDVATAADYIWLTTAVTVGRRIESVGLIVNYKSQQPCKLQRQLQCQVHLATLIVWIARGLCRAWVALFTNIYNTVTVMSRVTHPARWCVQKNRFTWPLHGPVSRHCPRNRLQRRVTWLQELRRYDTWRSSHIPCVRMRRVSNTWTGAVVERSNESVYNIVVVLV